MQEEKEGLASSACRSCWRPRSLLVCSGGGYDCRIEPHSAHQVDGTSAQRSAIGLDDVSPFKGIFTRETGETASPSEESAGDAVARPYHFSFQLAVNLVAALVCPYTAALHARKTVSKADRLRAKPNSQTP